MFCQHCGSQAADDQAFCQSCGAPLQTQALTATQVSSTPQSAPHIQQVPPNIPQANTAKPVLRSVAAHSAAQGSRKPKSQTPAVVAIISLGLSFILLFEFLIGPLISGRTIWGEPFRLGKSPAASSSTVMVSPDEPIAEIEGVRVDFADNLAAEAEFSLTKSSEISENELYTGIDIYDFTLEGQNEFATLVDITIPNTAAAEEAVKVAYYNEDLEVWESLPFEIADREIKFSITHFSRYGLIKYHQNRYRGPLTPLVVNFTELRKAMAGLEEDGLFEQFIEQKGQTGSNPWINKGLSVFNDAVGTVSVPVTYEALVAGAGDTAARELSDKLTKVGGAVTFLKIAYQWQAGDKPTKILQDNVFDICELILGGAALAMPGSVVLPVAGVLVFSAGAFYEYVFVPAYQDESLESVFKAYSDFCNFPHVMYDKSLAKALAEGTGEASPWYSAQNYNTKTKKWDSTRSGLALVTTEQNSKAKWQNALMDIYKLYQKDPKAMQERVGELVDEYLDAFWALDGDQQLQFAKDFCQIEEQDWLWPTESEISQMKESMKAELMRDLKAVFEDVQRTIIEEMKKTLQKDTEDLVLYLNQEIAFEVLDPEAEKPGFKNSRVAADFIRFETVADPAHKNDWLSQPEMRSGETVFTSTLYNYLNEGSPGEALFYKTKEDLEAGESYLKAPISITLPRATITLGQSADLTGKYSLDLQFMKTNLWGYSSVETALDIMLYQIKDLEVKKDGSFAVSTPARTLILMHYGYYDDIEAPVAFGTITLSGRIDPKTGIGQAEFSGSASGSWATDFYAEEYDITVSGRVSVEYNSNLRGLIFRSSPRKEAFIKLSGTEISTHTQYGETKVSTKTYDETMTNDFRFLLPR